MKLGIDIGRVLITPEGTGPADTSFIGGSIEDALATPPYEGMFDAVTELTQRFARQVWLVSKAGPRMQEKTRLWLAHHRFFERTGIASRNLRFCLERPQKADHCRALGITHFIDDRLDVLQHLCGVVEHRYLFGPQRKGAVAPHDLTACVTWKQTLRCVNADLELVGARSTIDRMHRSQPRRF